MEGVKLLRVCTNFFFLDVLYMTGLEVTEKEQCGVRVKLLQDDGGLSTAHQNLRPASLKVINY